MRIRPVRSITAASLLSAGLVAWSGCNTENPDGTPTNLGKIENKAGEIEKKVEEGAVKAGQKIEEGAVKAVDATGKVVEKAGENLETKGKDAVKEHVGDKAADVVEGTGKALDKAGEKIQGSVKDKLPK